MKLTSPWFLSLMALFILELTQAVYAEEEAELKFRARENFEMITVKSGAGSKDWKYASFSHTINIWYENPFHFAWGFATGPFAMSYQEVSGQSARPDDLGESIRLINHGLEAKWWYSGGLFLRGGSYVHQFNSHSGVKDLGYGVLGGFGYEYDWDGIGLAIETDFRWSSLFKNPWEIESHLITVGVHFYDWF